jgi:hypothetical protein
MASPKPLVQRRKFCQQAIGAFALHPLDQVTDRSMRPNRDHHMHMSREDMALQNIDARFLILFPD